MEATEGQEIVGISRGAGELSFEARLADGAHHVHLRCDSDLVPPADPALLATLLPAMRAGGELRVRGAVSPKLLRTQAEYQAIQRAWSLDWTLGEEPLREVEVRASARAVEPRQPTGRVAAFFSGGVDSWATVLANPDVTDLIFVQGFDLIPGNPDHAALAPVVEARLREAAESLELSLHVVETNLREMSDPLIRWDAYNASALAAVALLYEDAFDRVLIASDTDHETQVPLGASRMVDQLLGSERLELVDDGGRYSRLERLRRIVDHPGVQRALRVCWRNPGAAYNCGRCRKCLLTMISLEAMGVREKIETFPPELRLEPLEGSQMTLPIQLIFWEEVLDLVEASERPDLAASVRPLVESGKRELGLPDGFRMRRHRDMPGLGDSLRAAEARADAAERREAEARQQVQAILGSSSWRLTAPLRRLADEVRRRRAQ
ncbi:MAG TPA: hypothetical protein VFJ99_01320 [Solirubrobacterales bacterium]|nr:hypothetical protein [Solirubrobacterales bacterium]